MSNARWNLLRLGFRNKSIQKAPRQRLTSRELRLWRPIVAPLANAAGISDAEIGEQFDI